MTTIQNMLADIRRELMSTNPPLGVSTTPAEGFRTHRFESEVPLSCSTGEIAVSFILSGVKTVTVGGRFISYGAGEGLLSGAALPSTFRAMHASPEEPFLSVSLALDRATLIELAEHLPHTDQEENAELPPEAIFVFEPTEDLLFDFERLIKLLKTPELAPLHYSRHSQPSAGRPYRGAAPAAAARKRPGEHRRSCHWVAAAQFR